MTTAAAKTNKLLNQVLREVREVREIVEPLGAYRAVKTRSKKLPAWLKASLKDVQEGKVSGPFRTVDELMMHLEKR